jgi:hypothetical protein
MRLRWEYPLIAVLIVLSAVALAKNWPPPWLLY